LSLKQIQVLLIRCISILNLHTATLSYLSMRLIFKVLILVWISNPVFSQRIYSVKYESQADVKVYSVKYESQCDLKVYVVDYVSQAKDNIGLWSFVKYESQADKKVFFVDYESQSDLKIFFVKYKSQAGWKTASKKNLLYRKNQ
jgi:hypothetical protein